MTPELISLLDAQRELTEDLPYDLLGVRKPKLVQVYVRQAVRGQAEDDSSAVERPAGAARRRLPDRGDDQAARGRLAGPAARGGVGVLRHPAVRPGGAGRVRAGLVPRPGPAHGHRTRGRLRPPDLRRPAARAGAQPAAGRHRRHHLHPRPEQALARQPGRSLRRVREGPARRRRPQRPGRTALRAGRPPGTAGAGPVAGRPAHRPDPPCVVGRAPAPGVRPGGGRRAGSESPADRRGRGRRCFGPVPGRGFGGGAPGAGRAGPRPRGPTCRGPAHGGRGVRR